MLNWLTNNYIEVVGAIAGLIYLYPEIKQKSWVWPFGALTAILFIVIYFKNKFYADMGLQYYYLIISLYGWYNWSFSKKIKKEKQLKVSNIPLSIFLLSIIFTSIVYTVILYVLKNYTDSTVPYGDSFTTALSITATWMLARKYIEMWFLWIVVNLISLILYFYKGMHPMGLLYVVYFIMSFYGYFQWRKDLFEESTESTITLT